MTRYIKAALPFFVVMLLLVVMSSPAGAAAGPEMIRVAVSRGGDQVRIDGTGILVMDGRREQIRVSPPFTVKRDRQRVAVNGRAVGTLVISAPAAVSVNGKPYRGTIEVLPQDRGLLVINELPLEEYLVGLINCEISSDWPLEAIKAQAVVARSYALYQKESRRGSSYDLESTVLDQVYDGCAVEDARAARGVAETAGEVLTYNGAVTPAFFHSTCGGRTEASEQVWGGRYPYLGGVACRYCQEAPTATWEMSLPLSKIESLLKAGGIAAAGLRDIRTGPRNRSGRLTAVLLTTNRGTQEVPATAFRKALGYSLLRSTNFEVAVSGSSARFTGSGYGHGVGLCQWGARSRAADGFSYREILAYYYPGTVVQKAVPGL